MAILPLIVALALQPSHPIAFARAELSRELGANNASRVDLQNDASLGKEVYRIIGDGKRVRVMGGDDNGTMYGALEFAERYRNASRKNEIWKTRAYGKPYLAERGLNLFLTLPWDYKKNDTDYSLEALTDPNRWWFQNEDYWTTLLDLMARSRLNWLDIHGAWDISVTSAPNLYAYFVTSKTFPNVGVPQAVKDRNLAQLNHVIEMAHARGIRVSLMAYEANLRIPQNSNPGYEASEANIYTYTKEVVEQMIRRAPKLDALGYRIGESGKSESFFHCYGEAVKASGRDIPLITRSWITRRQNVLPLARASKDYTVEIKYNGEQWGAPYMIAGGRMANWYSYSFEDYLSDSSAVPDLPLSAPDGREPGAGMKAAKLWPGNLISPSPQMDRVAERGPGGGVQSPGRDARANHRRDADATGQRWPSNPYKIVWQVRANGTHRIFPFYNPDMVRSTIKTMKIGTATGYTIEGLDAYYPKSPDYYLANPADKYCDWIHQRDEMYWMTWGRLGYDPNVKDEVFESHMKKWFGSQAKAIAGRWAEASQTIPHIFQRYSLGPDHRNHAPELETGGSMMDFIQNEPFDSFRYRSIREEAAFAALRLHDGRIPPNVMQGPNRLSISLSSLSHGSIQPKDIPKQSWKRYQELAISFDMLSNLSDYYSGRFESANEWAKWESKPEQRRMDNSLNLTAEGWRGLSSSASADFYKPFTERLRMRTNTFHWRALESQVTDDVDRLRKSSYGVKARQFSDVLLEQFPRFTWTATKSVIECQVTAATKAWLLIKPLPSSTFFQRIPMARRGSSFVVTIPRPRYGACVAAEVLANGGLTRISVREDGKQPYSVIPALPGPTPQIYSTEEALTYLDPSVLDPKKHAAMLVAPRAWRFHNGFDKATIRKVLNPVERGMTLVVMQQDYVSGRYKMDWLPVPLKVENNPQPTLFDPGGALGLKRIETSDILWQRFVTPPPSPLPAGAERGSTRNWEVFGNGGVAHLKWGKGHIWMVNARLMQRMTHPGCARALKTLMEFCGFGVPPKDGSTQLGRDVRATGKPVVILDPGTEDAAYSTSFFPDFMNVLDIPFLTLGEVIAKEQGIDSFTPIPGKIADDDILQGNGERMVNAFLRNQVVQASKRATPSNLVDFEKERTRRKAELMRCLGLDPMPPKTPLNARVTGVIQRNGYRIEKLVFESRPKFYVTAHVYVPEGRDRLDGWDGLPGLAPRNASTPSNASHASPFPIIVNVNGHWAHKKDEDRIQLRCAFQALQGYIAIAVDSPGWSFEGNSLIERRPEGDHNDWFLVHCGTNATGYYVWDCIRALDYMATRSDADMSRIGITGASGGGLATLYTFAADDRYTAAVPVVYMASMELAPDNGCLCNHVPGTSQIGDRSDVIAIQAPKPVFVMGAQNDGEFPPAATLLTVEKMKRTWSLFPGQAGPDTLGLAAQATGRIFDGPHDYNQLMREQMIGFFNKWLKGEGDGSPVPQPPIEAINPEDRQLLALDPVPTDERTMRDLSLEYLKQPQNQDPITVNGGRPTAGDFKYKETVVSPTKRLVTFESEPGLVTPGILILPKGKPNGVRIHAFDGGKTQYLAPESTDGFAHLYIDILGTGELSKLEMRYLVYLGTSVAFKGGWQLVRAATAMKGYRQVHLDARGPLACQAVWWAMLLEPGAFAYVSREGPMASWEDALKPGASPFLVQPRAHLMAPLGQPGTRIR